jgi:hypothetical protein
VTFLEIFITLYPACALLIALWVILARAWHSEDARTRRVLDGRAVLVDGEWVILQEDGAPLCNLSAYFDDLPVKHQIRGSL